MRKVDVLNLFDYLYWGNGRILDAAERLTPEEFVAPTSLTTRGLRATLVHELDVEWSWRVRLQGCAAEDDGELRPEDYPNLAALRDHWRRDEAEMRAWLATLTDDDLAVAVGPHGNARPLWQYLVHVVTHAVQQQADAATLLTLAGRSPGELEYLESLRSS